MKADARGVKTDVRGMEPGDARHMRSSLAAVWRGMI